jgi:LPXTG-site transpeptidase (sortase) family protein
VVLEGSDTGTLRLGVGRLRNSGLPGDAGNVVLAGHRDTFFRSLREIRPGDQISLRTPQGTFPYAVDWTTVVSPRDTSVLAQTASPALTLVTCYPFYYVGSAPQRFIVRALPLGAAGTVAPRRPSPFAALSAPVTRPAVVRADVPLVTTAAAADVVPPIATPLIATPLMATPPIATPLIATTSAADDSVIAPDPPAQPRKGALKRAFHKIAGVFSGRPR